MGLFSGIAKIGKKLFKGIKKIQKKVFGIVKKVASKLNRLQKKFRKSKLGKALMIAAAIYFGGVSLEMWGGTGTATTLASSTIPTATTTGVMGGSSLEAISAAGLATGTTAATTAATTGATTSLGTQAMSLGGKALTAIQENPELAIAGGQLISSVFTPSAAEQQAEIARQRRESSNIAGVGYYGQGTPIDLGLVRRAQQQDLQTPTYQYRPGGQNV